MLMVSGILMGDITGRTKGEIMVFTFKNHKLRICARISNKPWDAFGCWYGNKYVISSEFKWLANMVSTSMLLINKVSFALEKSYNDHTLAGIRTLFRFYNSAGNAVRYFCIANVAKDLGKDDPECSSGIKVLESIDSMLAAQIIAQENQAIINLEHSQTSSFDSIPNIDNHYIRLMPDQRFEFEEDEEDNLKNPVFQFSKVYHETRKIAYDLGLEENDWIYDDEEDIFEDEEDIEWEYWENEDVDGNKPDLLKIDEGHEVINEDDKLLIMASGIQVCVPHMIAIKRMSKVRFRKDMDFSKSLAQRETERKSKQRRAQRLARTNQPLPRLEDNVTNWHDYKAVSHKFDSLDYLIEMHGRIVGMTLSPCHRYLYVNVRPWPRDYKGQIRSVSNPPPVGSKIDRHVLDLGRMSFVSWMVQGQNAFVASDSGPCGPICVTKHLVASGQEKGRKAAVWDRHHGVQVADFGHHRDVINAVALHPLDESVAVTVSDDMTVKLWRSKLAEKQLD